LRQFAALSALAALMVAGASSAHLVPGDPVHLDIEFDTYVAGKPLTFQLFISNPTDAIASFMWTSSCTHVGYMESERRFLAIWSAPGPCLTVMVGMDVPAMSSFLWHSWTLDTLPDDGCIRIDVSLNGYPVSGSGETCPGPKMPPPGTMSLSVSSPAAAKSGEAFEFTVQARTANGLAIEGVRVDAALGAEELPTAHTGLDGRLSITAPVPDVESTTLTTLLVRASGEGWRNASTTRTILIFPPDRRYLVLESRFATRDIIRSGEPAILELTVRGNDGAPVAEASLAVEITDPLVVEENVALGDGRHRLVLRAGTVSEGGIASVRIVANAPDWEGGVTVVDYAVLPPTAATDRNVPESVDLPPWEAFAALGIVSAVAVILFAVIRRHRKARDR
jgi:hypothetical protein